MASAMSCNAHVAKYPAFLRLPASTCTVWMKFFPLFLGVRDEEIFWFLPGGEGLFVGG